MADLKPQLAPIARELATLAERHRELSAESMAASMLAGLKRDIIDPVTRRASIDQAADVATILGERFDALDMDRKRELIRGMVEIRVYPGRSPERVKVWHLTVAGQMLNEDADEAQRAA